LLTLLVNNTAVRKKTFQKLLSKHNCLHYYVGATKLSFVEAAYEHFERCAFDALVQSSSISVFFSSVGLLQFVAIKISLLLTILETKVFKQT